MQIEWNERKRGTNLIKHGVDFADAHELFEQPFFRKEDTRQNYGERRFLAVGQIQGRVMVAAYTMRGDAIRIISLRKGNQREQKSFSQAIENGLGAD